MIPIMWVMCSEGTMKSGRWLKTTVIYPSTPNPHEGFDSPLFLKVRRKAPIAFSESNICVCGLEGILPFFGGG